MLEIYKSSGRVKSGSANFEFFLATVYWHIQWLVNFRAERKEYNIITMFNSNVKICAHKIVLFLNKVRTDMESFSLLNILLFEQRLSLNQRTNYIITAS